MSKDRFVMKEQDDTCTFKTYKTLLGLTRKKAVDEKVSLKMLLNVGLISTLNKTKNEMENILIKAEKEVKI